MKSDYSAIKQKINHDRKAKPRSFEEGEQVWVQRIQGKGHDTGGIVQKLSDYSYLVEVDGRVCRKHADQLKIKSTNRSDRENPPKVHTMTIIKGIIVYQELKQSQKHFRIFHRILQWIRQNP